MTDTARLRIVLEGQNVSEQAFRRASQDLNQLGLNVTRGSTITTQGTRQMATAANEAQRALSGLGAGLAQGIGVGGALGVAGLTAAVVSFGRESVQTFAAFERRMRETNALLGLTGSVGEASFQTMSRQVRDFAVAMGIDARGAADALYETISAGVPAGEAAFQVLRAGATAAIGGFTSTNTAVQGINAVLNAYKLTAADAARISDEMFAVVNRGTVTFEQYAQNIGIAVPIAAALGVTHAELGGIIANTTQQGVRSSEAFTSLRAVLGSLARPSEQSKELAEALGLEWNAEAVAARGLAGVLADLEQKTGGNKEAIGILTGDINAFNLVLANTGPNAEKYKEATQVVTNANGDATRAMEEVEKSTSRAWDRMLAKAQFASTAIGEVLATGTLAEVSRLETRLQRESAFLQNVGGGVGDFFAGVARSGRAAEWTEEERALYRLNMQRAAGRISVDEYGEAVRRLTETNRANIATRVEDEIEAEGRARLEASRATDQQTRAVTQNSQALRGNVTAALEARRQLEQLYRQQAERIERDAIQVPVTAAEGELTALQQQQRAAQRAEQEAIRAQQRALQGLQDNADRSRTALDRLKDSLSDANEEMQRLNNVSVQGTRALADRLFGIEGEIAARELQTAQEDAARAEARAAGLPRPTIDRRARRQREREIEALRQQGRVVELTDRVVLEPQRRAVQDILNPPQELPAPDLIAQVQAARTRTDALEAQIAGIEGGLLSQSQAVNDAQRRAQDAQLANAEAEARRQAEVDEAQRRLHELRLAAIEAERQRERERIAAFEKEVTDAGLTLPARPGEAPTPVPSLVTRQEEIQALVDERVAAHAANAANAVPPPPPPPPAAIPAPPPTPPVSDDVTRLLDRIGQVPTPPPPAQEGVLVQRTAQERIRAAQASSGIELPEDVARRLETLGEEAAQGFIDAIRAGDRDAAAAAIGLARSTADAIADHLEIDSPSRVLFRLGQQSVEGFLAAFRAAQPDVDAAMARLVADLPAVPVPTVAPVSVPELPPAPPPPPAPPVVAPPPTPTPAAAPPTVPPEVVTPVIGGTGSGRPISITVPTQVIREGMTRADLEAIGQRWADELWNEFEGELRERDQAAPAGLGGTVPIDR